MTGKVSDVDVEGLSMPELVALHRLLMIAIPASAKAEKIGAPVLAGFNADSEGATVTFAVEVEG